MKINLWGWNILDKLFAKPNQWIIWILFLSKKYIYFSWTSNYYIPSLFAWINCKTIQKNSTPKNQLCTNSALKFQIAVFEVWKIQLSGNFPVSWSKCGIRYGLRHNLYEIQIQTHWTSIINDFNEKRKKLKRKIKPVSKRS